MYTYYIHSQAKHTDLGPGPGIPSRQVFELCCCEIIDLLFSKEQQWMNACRSGHLPHLFMFDGAQCFHTVQILQN